MAALSKASGGKIGAAPAEIGGVEAA